MFFLTKTTKAKDFIEELCDNYKALMMKLALQITKNEEDAEEAVQDALFSLHKNRGKIKDIKSNEARNYIYTVTKNAAFKRALSQAKHSAESYHDYEELLPADEELWDKAFCDEYGFSEDIRCALNQLKSEDKDLICYHFGAGYTYREISEFMSVDEASLRKRMSRIKKILADIIRKENTNI